MIFAFIACLGYLASVVILYRQRQPSKMLLLLTIGVAIAAHLGQVLFATQNITNDMSVTTVLTVIAVCMTVIGAIRYFTQVDSTAYTVVALVAAVCVWFPVFLRAPLTVVNSWSLKVHITLSIAAYIALGFAALYACLLIIQDYRLRKGQSVFNLSLPLTYIERTMMSFTSFGEVLLTLSLATGTLFIYDLWGQHIAHKLVFGAIAWLVIALLLFRHYRQGFRGRQAAFWLLGGFACLVLAYFGSAFVLQFIIH